MGICTSKPAKRNPYASRDVSEGLDDNPKPYKTPANVPSSDNRRRKDDLNTLKKSPFFPFYSLSPARHFFSKKFPARPPSACENSTPRRLFRRPLSLPSPAKHIKAVLARWHGTVKPKNAAAIPEGEECEGGDVAGLDRSFGFSKQFTSRYEVGEEVGRGHFGYT